MGHRGCACSCQKTMVWLAKHEISSFNSKLSLLLVSSVTTYIMMLMFDLRIIFRWKSRNFEFWWLILGNGQKIGSKFCPRHINVIRKYKLHISALLPLCFLWWPSCFLTDNQNLSCENVRNSRYWPFPVPAWAIFLRNTYYYLVRFWHISGQKMVLSSLIRVLLYLKHAYKTSK